MASIQNSGEAFSPQDAARAVKAVEAVRPAGPGPRRPGEPETPPTPTDVNDAPAALAYKVLCQRHPDYDDRYWQRLRALYAGGRALFANEKLLTELFPRHRDELETVYEERKRRAYYTPYAGEIIDHIVAALCKQPVEISLGIEGTDDEEEGEGSGDTELPPWYSAFREDVSPPGGKVQSLAQLCRDQILTSLICGWTWTLVDLPALKDETGQPLAFTDRDAQETAGGLDAYACQILPECVVDWEEDATGELEWALVWTVECRRDGVAGAREWMVQRWTYYTRETWARYELKHKRDRDPQPTDMVPLVDRGQITLGRVPLIRLQVPEGLWAMSKLEGLAREHFNKRAALSWAETQSLLPELYEFIGPDDMSGAVVAERAEDPNRATNQPRGQGFVQVRGPNDKAQFIGPETGSFDHSITSCNNIRDEMHRVTHQMALSVDNSAAALKRSGDSKAQDKAATAVILTALGQLVREHAERVMFCVSMARGEDALAGRWQASGMEKFDQVQTADAIEQALSIDQLNIESATFRRSHRQLLVRTILGDEVEPEIYEKIDEELEENIPDEIAELHAAQTAAKVGLNADGTPLDDGSDEDEGDEDRVRAVETMRAPPRGATSGRRTIYKSK